MDRRTRVARCDLQDAALSASLEIVFGTRVPSGETASFKVEQGKECSDYTVWWRCSSRTCRERCQGGLTKRMPGAAAATRASMSVDVQRRWPSNPSSVRPISVHSIRRWPSNPSSRDARRSIRRPPGRRDVRRSIIIRPASVQPRRSLFDPPLAEQSVQPPSNLRRPPSRRSPCDPPLEGG